MARSIGMSAGSTVFRAVITKKYRRNDEPFTVYEGPYGSKAAARARVTFWQNCFNSARYGSDEETGEYWATGYVEEGQVTWIRKD